MGSVTSLLSTLLVAWFCCLLPAFQTFKALTHRPVLETLLERWCKYWTLVGIIFAYQGTLEQFVSWFPLYWEIKSLFLIFLALPQTEGSTYIYDNFLKPYLVQNEDKIDATIDSIQSNTFAFVTARLQDIWQAAYRVITKAPAAVSNQSGQAPATSGQQPGQPAAPSFGSFLNAVQTYGPSVLNALQPKAGAQAASTPSTPGVNASGVSTPVPEQRTPYTSEPDGSTPAFPEPQHFTS